MVPREDLSMETISSQSQSKKKKVIRVWFSGTVGRQWNTISDKDCLVRIPGQHYWQTKKWIGILTAVCGLISRVYFLDSFDIV